MVLCKLNMCEGGRVNLVTNDTEPSRDRGSRRGRLLQTNANSKSDTRWRDRNERTTTHVEKDNQE